MSTRLKIVAITLAISAAGAAAAVEARSPFESAFSEIFLFCFGEDTRFAPDYSDEAFGAVKIGDSEVRVRNLLGKPLSEAASPSDERMYLYYSDSPGSTHYRIRNVRLSGGKVEAVVSGLHVD